MACVGVGNTAVTNCAPSNQNTTGRSLTAQVYVRDLGIAAVVCFAGGVGLALLGVLIYRACRRRKRTRTDAKLEGGEDTAGNHVSRHPEGPGKRMGLRPSKANGRQPWRREAAILVDPRAPTGHTMSRPGDGGHFRCAHCGSRAGPTGEEQERRTTPPTEEEDRRRRRGGGELDRPLRPAYATGRDADAYRGGPDGRARAAYGSKQCDSCRRTFEPEAPEQQMPQGGRLGGGAMSQYVHHTRDPAVPGGGPRASRNPREENMGDGGERRGEMRSVTFDVEAWGAPERESGDVESGGAAVGSSGEASLGQATTGASSRLLRVKLNLNPLRRSKVHPKKKGNSSHPEPSSPRKDKWSGEKRRDGKTKGQKAERGSSVQRNKHSREQTKKSKSKSSTKDGEEKGNKTNKMPSSKTKQGALESSEQQTPANANDPSGQSGQASSAIGQSTMPPTNGQLAHNVNSLAQLIADRTRSGGLSLLGAASSQLAGSSLSLRGGNFLSTAAITAPAASAMLPGSTANSIAPNIGTYSRVASSASLGSLSLGRQGASALSNPANVFSANAGHNAGTNAALYATQPGGSAANAPVNPRPVTSAPNNPAAAQPLANNPSNANSLGSTPVTQGPQGGEGNRQLASQPPPAPPTQARAPPGEGGSSPAPPRPPGPAAGEGRQLAGPSVSAGPTWGSGVPTTSTASDAGTGSGDGKQSASRSAEGGVTTEGGVDTPGGGATSEGDRATEGGVLPDATLLQQEYISAEGGSSPPKRKLRLVLPEKTPSRPPTALERKIR